MTPMQIKDYLDEWPWSQEAEERYRGVDGSKVPREQWLNPPPGILPKKPSEEERAERRRIWEEQMKERERNGGSESGFCCRPGVKQSDHKILE
ncbi:hypothetical protein F5X99DRAFT_403630 [Biscogniauxia marginata]|nr:hypothetical protein F5X99DRAFT_403630 [Biscogniauxia marginata]